MLEKADVLNSTVQISPPPVVLSSLGELRCCSLFTTWRPVSSWFNFIKSLNNAWSQLLKSEHLIYVKVFGLLRRTHLTLRTHWGLAEPTTPLTTRQAQHVPLPLLRFLPSCLCQTLASPSALGLSASQEACEVSSHGFQKPHLLTPISALISLKGR